MSRVRNPERRELEKHLLCVCMNIQVLHTWTVVTPFNVCRGLLLPCHVSVLQHHKNDCETCF